MIAEKFFSSPRISFEESERKIQRYQNGHVTELEASQVPIFLFSEFFRRRAYRRELARFVYAAIEYPEFTLPILEILEKELTQVLRPSRVVFVKNALQRLSVELPSMADREKALALLTVK